MKHTRYCRLSSLLLAIALSSLCACSIFSSPSQKLHTSKRGDLIPDTPLITKKSIGLEVIWEVPAEPVDGFVIRYGNDKNNLSQETTIFLSELHEEKDQNYGPVYRYTIRNIKDTAPLFVSVAAFKGDVLSNFSDIIAETPQESLAR